ncbi:MAG TPA: crotonase/enoyl-CoA hydratase family protein [Acidimicrobiales bacterium]|nr:crotonase/enoyl-CoA hydratase family protein [Acidimicrobiales bacterium]
MSGLVTYRSEDQITSITMDDGKVNVLSPEMLSELDGALSCAQSDGNVVVLAGRSGIFSAGFDLSVLRGGGPDAISMLRSGFELSARILEFPLPVVIACPGHAVAMGVFLLLSGDYRIGVDGPYRITANEVAIGLTMPRAAVEICRQRLTPAHFNRAVMLAETFSPAEAVKAGFLDMVVSAEDLLNSARGTATALASLDLRAHSSTKKRARAETLTCLRNAIEADMADLTFTG